MKGNYHWPGRRRGQKWFYVFHVRTAVFRAYIGECGFCPCDVGIQYWHICM